MQPAVALRSTKLAGSHQIQWNRCRLLLRAREQGDWSDATALREALCLQRSLAFKKFIIHQRFLSDYAEEPGTPLKHMNLFKSFCGRLARYS